MQEFYHDNLNICENGADCKTYQRLLDGGERVDDQYHMAAYEHPPRKERIIPEEFSTFRAHEKTNCTWSNDDTQYITRSSDKFL
jgi:hypothetical protein